MNTLAGLGYIMGIGSDRWADALAAVDQGKGTPAQQKIVAGFIRALTA